MLFGSTSRRSLPAFDGCKSECACALFVQMIESMEGKLKVPPFCRTEI